MADQLWEKFQEHLLSALETVNRHKWITLGVLATGCAAVQVARGYYKNKDLPPGPIGLPVLGCTSFLTEGKLYEYFLRLGKKHGDVMSFYVGGTIMVVLNSHRAIKEAFVTRGPDFADRPAQEGLEIFQIRDEIFNAHYSEKWKEDKKFAVKTLRSFGFGTPASENKISSQAERFLQFLTANEGKPVDISDSLKKALACVIFSIVYGKHYIWEDEELVTVVDQNTQLFASLGEASAAFMFGKSWIVRFLFRKSIADTIKWYKTLEGYVFDRIDEHKKNFDPNNLRDVLDAYLKERDSRLQFDKHTFAGTTILFFSDAVDTLSVQLAFMFFYLAHYQEIQQKLYEEIEEVCGTSQAPRISDKADMPYTEAFILEAFRMSSVAPLSGPHSASSDTPLDGFRIPREAFIFANMYAVHMDPEIFENPTEFRPERHLDKEGKLLKSATVIPFGVGRRMCLGEQLGRMEIFLFVTNVIQQVKLIFPEDKPTPSLEPPPGLLRAPPPFKIVARTR